MRKFEFAPARKNLFTGFAFYRTYKDSVFLQDANNINKILNESYQLRVSMKELEPGESLQVAGMYIKPELLLAVKKGGPGVNLENKDFTLNRLAGLAAAYVIEHRKHFPEIKCSEAKALGLSWDNTNASKARLYLACVSGSEHFLEQFSFLPLICALRKVHLGKLKMEFLTKIAKIKKPNGMTMFQMLQANPQETEMFWSHFPGSTPDDFKPILDKLAQ